MVVRNEALFIRDAIESARPVVDEMVVVDTGSTDDTPEIARRLGARVIHAAWPGDLGKAHDLPVAHAQGDWVLSLDGDEALDPGTRHLVRDLAASGAHDGYILPVRNYTYDWIDRWQPSDPRDPLTFGAAGYVETAPVRLFRRCAHYTYSGRLHQTMRHAIIRSGGRLGTAPVPIHHYGLLRSDRSKSTLYAKLARQQAHDAPDDPRSWIELGIALGDSEAEAAADAFRRARTLGERPTASFLLATALLDLARPAEAIPLLREAIRGNPRDTLTCFHRADAWESLGTAFEDLARPREAERAYRAAMRARADSPAAVVNLAALLAEKDRTGEAEALVERLLERYRGYAIVWNTLGVIRLRQGDPAGAREALETALDIDPGSVPAQTNLGIAYGRLGHPRKAARALAAASTPTLGNPAMSSRGAGRFARSRARVTIVMVARLAPGMFPRRMLDYLEPLADLHPRVLIAGSGARRHEIEPEIRDRGLTRIVRFVGPVTRARVPAFLRSADIGLHLTETHQELCPVAILEMMAAGLPIVAEPKAGLAEMVTSGTNGYLERDQVAITSRLRELILSPGLRRRMGAASRRAAARFDVTRFDGAMRQLVRSELA